MPGFQSGPHAVPGAVEKTAGGRRGAHGEPGAVWSSPHGEPGELAQSPAPRVSGAMAGGRAELSRGRDLWTPCCPLPGPLSFGLSAFEGDE